MENKINKFELEKLKNGIARYEMKEDNITIVFDDSGEEMGVTNTTTFMEVFPNYSNELTDTVVEVEKEKVARTLNINTSDKAIIDIDALFKRGKLILNPEWQRNYVWPKRIASRLIESLMMNIPVPPVYISENISKEGEKTYDVVDGRQRLESIKLFFEDKLRLSELDFLTSLNKKKYSELPDRNKEDLNEATIRLITIKSDTDPTTKLDLFHRINTGSKSLSKQEVRNAYYINTPFGNAIKKIAESREFAELFPNTNNAFYNRFKHYELIGRSLAFASEKMNNVETRYKGSIDNFLIKNYTDYKITDDNIKEYIKQLGIMSKNPTILSTFHSYFQSGIKYNAHTVKPSYFEAVMTTLMLNKGEGIDVEKWNEAMSSVFIENEKVLFEKYYLFSKANPSLESHKMRLELLQEHIEKAIT